MLFSILVLLSALLIEGIGTYVSVVGLSALFAKNPVIIILAIALDIGKVISISFLYKHWKKINWLMKSYMIVAAIVLMIITSTGCFGYLSGQFQRSISGVNQNSVLIMSLEREQNRLQHRKEEIDNQIAKLPDNVVRGRRQLLKEFTPEVKNINLRLLEIDKQLPQLKIESLRTNVDTGPIIYVSQAFNTDPEHAVKWVILTIIFVFDPLAIALLLAGNFLLTNKNNIEISQSSSQLPMMSDDAKRCAKDLFNAQKISAPATSEITIDKIEEIRHQMHKSDEELYLELGRQRYIEDSIEKFDHLVHEDLGRQKPNEKRLETSPEKPPHEVIQVKSQLENISNRSDVIMQNTNDSSMPSSYQDMSIKVR